MLVYLSSDEVLWGCSFSLWDYGNRVFSSIFIHNEVTHDLVINSMNTSCTDIPIRKLLSVSFILVSEILYNFQPSFTNKVHMVDK